MEVIIDNGDELTLTVKFTMPTLPDGLNANDVKRTPYVRLEYGANKIVLLGTGNSGETNAPDVRKLASTSGDISTACAGVTVTYECVLDSLDTSKQFNGLFSDPVPALGNDFTVTAGLTLSADGYIERAYYAQNTDAYTGMNPPRARRISARPPEGIRHLAGRTCQ